jgi:uncharacterized protein (TIGR03545 family)
MMRKDSLVLLCAFILALFVLQALFLDTIVRNAVQTGLTKISGNKVEIGNTSISFFPLALTISELAIIDNNKPTHNILQLQKLHASIELSKLLTRQLIINNIAIEGVSTNKLRNNTAKLEHSVQHATQSTVTPQHQPDISQAPQATTAAVDSKAPSSKTQSATATMDSTDLSIDKQVNLWQQQLKADQAALQLATASNKQDITAFKIEVTKYSTAIEQADVQDIDTLTKQYDILINKGKHIVKNINKQTQQISSIVAKQKQAMQMLKKAGAADKQKLYNSLDFEKIKTGKLSNTLLKGPLEEKLNRYLSMIALATQTIAKLKDPEEEKPSVFKGVTVPFPTTGVLPAFLIKAIGFSSLDRSVTGTIKNISSNEAVLQQPVTILLKDEHSILSSTISTLAKQLTQKWQYKADPLEIKNITLLQYDNQSLIMESAFQTIHATVNLTGKEMVGHISLLTNNIKTNTLADNSATSLLTITQQVLQESEQINTDIKLSGTIVAPHIKISSDIDKRISRAITDVFNQHITKMKQQIDKEIDDKISQYKQDLSQLVDIDALTLQTKRQQQQANSLNKKAKDEKDKATQAINNQANKLLKQEQQKLEEQADKLLKSLF